MSDAVKDAINRTINGTDDGPKPVAELTMTKFEDGNFLVQGMGPDQEPMSPGNRKLFVDMCLKAATILNSGEKPDGETQAPRRLILPS